MNTKTKSILYLGVAIVLTGIVLAPGISKAIDSNKKKN